MLAARLGDRCQSLLSPVKYSYIAHLAHNVHRSHAGAKSAMTGRAPVESHLPQATYSLNVGHGGRQLTISSAISCKSDWS